jgi:hypothetical protein
VREQFVQHRSFVDIWWRARTKQALAAASLLAVVACGTAPRPALVFDYAASDGTFSYGFELYEDRTWHRSEHSGTVTPNGRLSRTAMRRFEALLRAAPYVLEPRECEDDQRVSAENGEALGPRQAWAEITDASRDRSVRTDPCFDADETTGRLLNCVESLADRSGSEDACRLARSSASARR